MGLIQEGDYTIRYQDDSAILWFFKSGFEVKVDHYNNRSENLMMAFKIVDSYMRYKDEEL